MINGGWDVLEVIFMSYFWVETSGKTLEEIDSVLEGSKHSEGPDLEDIKRAKAVGEAVRGESEGLLEGSEGYGSIDDIR